MHSGNCNWRRHWPPAIARRLRGCAMNCRSRAAPTRRRSTIWRSRTRRSSRRSCASKLPPAAANSVVWSATRRHRHRVWAGCGRASGAGASVISRRGRTGRQLRCRRARANWMRGPALRQVSGKARRAVEVFAAGQYRGAAPVAAAAIACGWCERSSWRHRRRVLSHRLRTGYCAAAVVLDASSRSLLSIFLCQHRYLDSCSAGLLYRRQKGSLRQAGCVAQGVHWWGLVESGTWTPQAAPPCRFHWHADKVDVGVLAMQGVAGAPIAAAKKLHTQHGHSQQSQPNAAARSTGICQERNVMAAHRPCLVCDGPQAQ